MKQRKLKGYVLPTLYVIVLMLIFGAVSLVSNLLKSQDNYTYTTEVFKETDEPVINITGGINPHIINPYVGDSVQIDKYFYDINGEEARQEQSLIVFENTYMKNTGVLYKADEAFDCVAVLDGTILNIKQDEVLGNVVEVEHNTNLRTIYYSVDNIKVKVGDFISQGESIATSGNNKINGKQNNLLFEVYYNGTLIDPLNFLEMDPSTLN